MEKYGIKLVAYRGQPMDMWVYGSDGRIETSKEEAYQIKCDYENKNPGGLYILEIINR